MTETSDFKPSNLLRKYMEEEPRDRYDIIGALIGYINADPQFKTDQFEKAIAYVISQGISEKELYAPFDRSLKYENDESRWNEEYYSYARIYLKDNFCRERIDHVKAVAKHLYRDQPAARPEKRNVEECASGKKAEGQNPSRWLLVGALAAVIIILILILVLNKK